MKKYQEEDVFLLPSEHAVLDRPSMNFNQIYLQECLLMLLWSVVRQMGSRLDQEIDLMKMF